MYLKEVLELLLLIFSAAAEGCIHGTLKIDSNSHDGRIQLCLYTHWGAISTLGFYSSATKVACRQLGYDVDTPGQSWSYYYYGGGGGNVWTIGPQCDGSEKKLIDCKVTLTTSTNYNEVGVRCPSNSSIHGQVRLVGGLVDTEGTVELNQNGAWNSLCSYRWGYQEAFVVCRQLGLPATGALWYTNAYFGEGHGTPILTNWRCFGNESFLSDCLNESSSTTCYHQNDVGVSCQGLKVTDTCISGGMQLVLGDGTSIDEGRVEYCSNGVWGTVSNYYGFDTNDGKVVCRKLGHQHPRVQIFNSLYYGQGAGPIVYAGLGCDGMESKLEDCDTNLPAYYATHYQDVGIKCFEQVFTCNDGEVRLVNGSNINVDVGRVEVCLGREWGTMFDDYFDRSNAQVVCRQLGHQVAYATEYRNSYFGDGNLSVNTTYFRCTGSESKLTDCTSYTYNGNLLYGNTAGVRCYDPTGCTEREIRLVGGETEREGDVQICQRGVWGYVCSNYWNSEQARIVCQQFNYSTSWYSFSRSSFFSGNSWSEDGPVVIDSIQCYSSNIESIFDCDLYDADGNTLSSCSNTGGVMCEEDVNCTDGSVQLVDGNSSSEGRVELCSNGVWTTISDSTWDYNDARVVCRQLGYYDKWAVAITGSYFTSGYSRVYLYYVFCNGNELKLTYCSKAGYSNYDSIENWYNLKRAGVSCETNSSADHCNVDGSIRLMGGTNEREGRVEVCMGGYWGTVCSDGWSEEDALVVCRQAGYDTLRPIPLDSSSFGRGTGPVHMTYVTCSGIEQNITECQYRIGIGTNNCHHAKDAGVVCTSGTPTYYSVSISTRPSEAPFAIGSKVSLHCGISPDPSTGSTYRWRTTVPGVSITHQDSSHPNATITIPVGHTKYGYYYCLVQNNGSTLATGFVIIEVKQLLFSSQLMSTATTGMTVTLQLNKTLSTIDSYFRQLNWYHDVTNPDFGVPLKTDGINYILGADNMSLTILNINVNDAGVYTARYDGLLLYPHNKTCEQQLLQALRHYPALEPVTFTLSVDGSGANYFGKTQSYFSKNTFTTSFNNKEPISFNTTATNLPSDTIYMASFKDGNEDFLKETESLFYSDGNAYRELHFTKPSIIHSGNYEAQLQLTSLFMGFECNSIYTNFISRSNFLGIDGVVILQSTMQRLAYYEIPQVQLTTSQLSFSASENATLRCSATGGYPLFHNISFLKNNQVILNTFSGDITLTTNDKLPGGKYGVYNCLVNNSVEITTETTKLQEKATLIIDFDTNKCKSFEVLDFVQPVTNLLLDYCSCSLDQSALVNSSLSCSRRNLQFKSELVYSSDDGSVTASSAIAIMQFHLAEQENPVLIVGGEEIPIITSTSSCSISLQTGLFFAGFFTAILICITISVSLCIFCLWKGSDVKNHFIEEIEKPIAQPDTVRYISARHAPVNVSAATKKPAVVKPSTKVNERSGTKKTAPPPTTKTISVGGQLESGELYEGLEIASDEEMEMYEDI